MSLQYLLGWHGPSGFGSSTTAEEVAQKYSDRCKDKVFVVTGCNTGIGKETVLQLVKQGAIIVMGNRNKEKSHQMAEEIRAAVPGARLHELTLDLSDLASVHGFVKDYKALKLPGINCLINNAGVMACPLSYTTDKFETQFGTNHLGHFLLTNLLFDELKKGQPARVVNLSSTAHSMAYSPEGIRLDDLDGKKRYSPWEAYGQSKLANILHAKELDKRCKERGLKISAFSLHPGVIKTDLYRHTRAVFNVISSIVMAVAGKSIPQGAATTVYCALSEQLDDKGGGYYADVNEYPPSHPSFEEDPDLPKKLWEVSAHLTDSDLPAAK